MRHKTTYLVVFPDLTNQVGESFVYVDALLRRCLDELAAKVLCEVAALCQEPRISPNSYATCTKLSEADVPFIPT